MDSLSYNPRFNTQVSKISNGVQILNGFQMIYNGFKKLHLNTGELVSQVVVYVLLIICIPLVIPVLLGLQLLLYFLLKFYIKNTTTDLNVNSKNYQSFRVHFDKIYKSYQEFKENNSEVDKGEVPFLLKGFYGQVKRIETVLGKDIATMQKQLAQIDGEVKNGQYFILKSEKELWEQRCKAYDYLV